jgi:ATP-binding cassette subfamily C protein CydC
VDARAMRPAAVRRIVGLCEQAPHLFDASIRQNLLFAREDATDDELVAVLARVGLADWAAERGGLDARVGDRGALVSGGQAQRIALARALLADFPVLVLDEPTADVDADRAQAVLRDVLAAARDRGRGVLLLTHTDVPGDLVDRTVELGPVV